MKYNKDVVSLFGGGGGGGGGGRGGDYDVPHQIEEKVSNAIHVWAPFKFINVF